MTGFRRVLFRSETYLRVCPCVLLSDLNDRGIVASCEIDMCSAITMRAMALASEEPTTVLDWNNNCLLYTSRCV